MSIHRGAKRCWHGGAILGLLLGACAAPAEFVNRPDRPIAWPAPDAMPRVELEFAYGGSEDVVRHPGWLARLAALLAGEQVENLVSPAGLARSGDLLWIADPGAGCVHRLSLATGEHTRCAGTVEHPFRTPVGVAVAAADAVFVTDAASGFVTILDDDGAARTCFGGPEIMGRPTGICFDRPRDRLLVVDTAGCRVLAFDRRGKALLARGERGTQPGQFNFPTNVAVTSTGRVLVVDSLNFRVQVLSPEFEPISSFGGVGRGPGDFASPRGIAVDSADNIYVVDSMFDNFQIFDIEGRLLLAVGASGRNLGELYLPTGICIDGEDRIHVADAGNSRVQIMRLHGVTKGGKP